MAEKFVRAVYKIDFQSRAPSRRIQVGGFLRSYAPRILAADVLMNACAVIASGRFEQGRAEAWDYRQRLRQDHKTQGHRPRHS